MVHYCSTMDRSHESKPSENIPTLTGAAVFRSKSLLLQLRRLLKDNFASRVKRFPRSAARSNEAVVAESRTPLWTEVEPEERRLVAGKIQNLRLAIAQIDGVQVSSGETFSFWKQVGRASRLRGFVHGREIREGCIIPTVGGGLCQLSNALYDAALKANFEIVERHPHTQAVAGSLAEQGRDATVFWNYIDLRFRSKNTFQIEAKMGSDHLTVRFRGTKDQSKNLHQIMRQRMESAGANSCATCGTGSCFRSVRPAMNTHFGRSAFLVDEFSPEINKYVDNRLRRGDLMCIPIDGHRFKKPNYAWNTNGKAEVKQSPMVTAERAFRSRRLASQGAERQRNLLAMHEKLAANYAKKLSFDVLHVVVHQHLLPFLWRDGHLSGRVFDVIMTGLPVAALQKQLDLAYSLHPESRTLGDFRADPEIVQNETDALERARSIITPHTAVGAIFGERATLLDWELPKIGPRDKKHFEKPCVVFPSSTVGRKGCYELREALRGIDVKLMTLGPNIESENFWNGYDVVMGGDDWVQYADAVVLPAYVEHRPHRLLLAAAMGIPVIASPACGVENVAAIETINAANIETLTSAIEDKLSNGRTSRHK